MREAIPQAAAYAAAQGACARESLLDFSALLGGPGYEQPPHVRLLIDHLEALERRDISRLIVEMPPRSSKSTHVSRFLPAWWLGRHPADGVIVVSYGEDLATGHSRAVRDLVNHPRYPFRLRLRSDVTAAGHWQTVAGGGLIAAGIGSGITGEGGHLVVLDDLISGRADAESQVVRDRTWAWYQDTLTPRIMRGGVIVAMGTRWHEDDPIGRILAGPGAADWTRLRLPYYAEPGDVLGRPAGTALPVFGRVPSVDRGEISAYGWSAEYQQRPTPAGGGVFKAEWMRRRYSPDALPALRKLPRWRVIMTADLGGKQGVGHDPSAIATWGSDGLSRYLLDYWSGQDDYTDVKARAKALNFQYRPRMFYVEDATWAQPLISDLRRESGIPVHAVPPRGSKWTRADAISRLFEGGTVALPERAPWLDGWLHDMLSFPNALHDEAVDTTSLALAVLRDAPRRIRTIAIVAPTAPAPEGVVQQARHLLRERRARA